MRFGVEKRRLLALLAFLAPLPLPLDEPRPRGVIPFVTLALFWALVVLFERRSQAGKHHPPRPWVLNLLGLAYVPVLLLDLSINGRVLLVRPMVHLALFALVAKLFSLERERDKWHALVGIFFLFVVSTATSTSVLITVYLVSFLCAGCYVLMRFASLHARAYSALRVAGEPLAPSVTVRSSLALALAVVLLAIPLFLVLPRFDQPYLEAALMGGLEMTSLGVEDVTLDSVGRIRESQAVVLRVDVADRLPRGELRLRSGSYDRLVDGKWSSGGGLEPTAPSRGGRFLLGEEVPERARWRFWSARTRSPNLALPAGAVSVAVSPSIPVLLRDRQGNVKLPARPRGSFRYEVALGEENLPIATPPELNEALDLGSVSDPVYRLAHEVALGASPIERARSIERYLLEGYAYTLDLGDRRGADPIEEFLLRNKSGHCELFAASMVMMLRSVGVPARFVTGYLGGESTNLGYAIVRQSNAHAWVEAYLPEIGWTTFDPTPPAGRPSSRRLGYGDLVRQAFDWVVFIWDRNIVAFGQAEQVALWQRVSGWFKSLFGATGTDATAAVASVPAGEAAELVPAVRRDRQRERLIVALLAGALALMPLLGFVLWRKRRRAPDHAATLIAAYQDLVRLGARTITGWPTVAAPLEVKGRLRRALPDAAPDLERFFAVYLPASFGARRPEREDVAIALRAAQAIERALRRRARQGAAPQRRAA